MKQRTLLGLSCLLLTGGALRAQHQHTAQCGVNAEMGALIKSRMLEERARVSAAEIEQFRSQRATTHIPVTCHIVGDASGNGRVDMDEVLDMFCGLQNDYLPQDIHFYLNGQFRYVNNSTLYNDAFVSGSRTVMNSFKVANTLNAYVGPSANNPAASYYQPLWAGVGDFVFLLTAQLTGSSAQSADVTAHEFGHFFSLMHTFYGWEDIDYDATYAGANAPSSIGGETVEKVSRTTGSNCASAADGFCDTPADYFSTPMPSCPYNGVAKDPTGAQLDPDETNIMSYFDENCTNQFSTEQKNAIAANIISRNWTNFTPPTTATIVDPVNLVSPAQNTQVNLAGATDVTLTWDAVPNATGYYIEVDRTFNGTPLDEIVRAIVYNTTTYTFSTSLLQSLKQYRWRIRPFNAYHTCPGFEASRNFITIQVVGVEETEAAQQAVTMEVMPNPVNGSEIRVAIQAQNNMVAGLRLYSADGKMLLDLENQTIQPGDTFVQIPTDGLPNGMYVLTMSSAYGNSQQKILIQR